MQILTIICQKKIYLLVQDSFYYLPDTADANVCNNKYEYIIGGDS